MKRLSAKSYAKINTFLAVGPLCEDGYHSIRTVYEALELHDVIEFTSADAFSFECSDKSIENENNLVVKAIRFMSELAGYPKARIMLRKNIPTEAGLGGGSSNAATALVCANMFMGGKLSERDLFTIAQACGSDCPFFLLRKARACAQGRGEKLRELSAKPKAVVIAKPAAGSSTPEAYAQLDSLGEREFLEYCREEHNDFDLIASQESRDLMGLLKELGARSSHLCGSGSAVYGTFDSDSQAATAASALSAKAWAVHTRTMGKLEEPIWTQ